MNAASNPLAAGRRLEQLGDLAGAEIAYRKILATSSDLAEGWYRLGMVCLNQKRLSEAINHFELARSMDFQVADTWNLQGISLAWLNRTIEAEIAFRHAVEHAPRFAEAHFNLGKALFELDRLQDAEECLLKTLQLSPKHISAIEFLAAIYRQMKQPVKALECLEHILRFQPTYVPAIVSISKIQSERGQALEAETGYRMAIQLDPNSADAYVGLGVLLADHRHYAEACDLFWKAIAIVPNSAQFHSNLGNAQRELGQYGPAEASLKKAIELDPDDVSAHHNLGKLFSDLGDLNLATDHYRRAMSLEPNNANAQVGLGSVFAMQGNFSHAEECFQHALAIDPKRAQAHFNLSLIHLVRGDLADGFRGYEYRWQTSSFSPRGLPQPMWNGETVPDKTVLIHCEQGLGDTLQFCRYLQLVKQRVGRVVLEVPRSLLPLLRTCPGVDCLVAAGDELRDFDFQSPLLSLPRILGTTLQSLPDNVPYLTASPDRVDKWEKKLGPKDGLRIGIAWRGNPCHQFDKDRSVPLTAFEPLAKIDGVTLISLQKGQGSDDIKAIRDPFGLIDFGSELDLHGGAFMDTAALMKNIDLVISVDSAPAHLAGGLGVPVWLVLSRVADWRWLLNREDSPWYPTMRLFRQTISGDWQHVFGHIADQLKAYAETERRGQ